MSPFVKTKLESRVTVMSSVVAARRVLHLQVRIVMKNRDKSVEFIDALLKDGADVNTRDTDGWTALMCAANSNRIPEVTRYFGAARTRK